MKSKPSENLSLTRVKGSDRIQINNILAAACITIMSILLGLSNIKLNDWLVAQLSLTTPLLITSSLAYAKLGYRSEKEYTLWDNLGWITLTIGYTFLLNTLFLLLYITGYPLACWIAMGITILLFIIYSLLDVIAKKNRLKEKIWKLGFNLTLMITGTVLPILLKWVTIS